MTSFKQLEAFVTIAEMGTFDAAARQLGIAQSAISRHIQEFEARFRYPLFDRSGRNARLTLEGSEVLTRARDVLKKRDVLLERLVRKDALLRKLRLGVTELTALTWLPLFVDALRHQFPGIAVDVEVEHSVPLHERLCAGRLDLVVVPNAFDLAGLLCTRLGVVRNGWFCSPSLAVPDARIKLAELHQYPLLLQAPQSGAGVLMRSWFARNGLRPRNSVPSNSVAALEGLAVSGLGIAHLPVVLSRPLVERGLLRELRVVPPLPGIRYVALARADSATSFHRAIALAARRICDFHRTYAGGALSATHAGGGDVDA